jgi:hypothetical protein
MIRIEFLSLETQDAIYEVAHRYEGFEILDENNLCKSFYKNIEIAGGCDFGLERAISDYLLFNNDFSISGKYNYIIKNYQGENRIIKDITMNSKRKSTFIREKYLNLGKDNNNSKLSSKDLIDMFEDNDFWK